MVRKIRNEVQDQNNWNIVIILTRLITEYHCIVVCDIAKEIGVTLTATSLKIRNFGHDKKHVVRSILLVTLDAPALH